MKQLPQSNKALTIPSEDWAIFLMASKTAAEVSALL